MDHKPPPPHVVVVGGGLGGLAAVSALVDRGLRLTLLESRPRLGGRASSFTDPRTGEMVDNCQHISMACCTNLADFCRRVGVADLYRRDPAVTFLSPENRISRLQAGIGPAPFHLAGSFVKANYLNWNDKLRVAYGMACLARNHDARPGEPFSDWLLRHGQNVRTINLFWATVLVSALNERLEQMDFDHARRVFVDGFLINRSGYQMELPIAPLGELYGSRLETWLRDHGVEVRLTTGVRDVDCGDDATLQGVTLRTGEKIPADFVVLAVSYDRVAGMFNQATQARMPALAGLRCLESSPITGIHLWFDRPVCPFDHVVTPGRFIHWVFNHTAIQGREATTSEGADKGQYLQIVISAAYDLLAMDKAAIRDAVLADLAEMWPAVREASLTRWWVVTEHGATFAVRPGVDAYRPAQRTPIDGLFLAGDFTDTGWPATMEGAVRSGYLAAQGILEDLDRPARLIRPDLKATPLAAWLVGRSKAPAGPPPSRFVPRLDALDAEDSPA